MSRIIKIAIEIAMAAIGLCILLAPAVRANEFKEFGPIIESNHSFIVITRYYTSLMFNGELNIFYNSYAPADAPARAPPSAPSECITYTNTYYSFKKCNGEYINRNCMMHIPNSKSITLPPEELFVRIDLPGKLNFNGVYTACQRLVNCTL